MINFKISLLEISASLSEAAVRRSSSKVGVLKNYAIFAGNTCFGVFFNKVQVLQVWNFIKKKFQQRSFPVNIAKFLRTDF